MNEENKASLVIYDYEDNGKLADIIGLQPTAIFIKGEKRTFGNGKHSIDRINEHSSWRIESTQYVAASETVTAHLDYLLQMIEENADKISTISKNYTVQLSVVSYSIDANLGLTIKPVWLSTLGELNIEIDIDMYFIGE